MSHAFAAAPFVASSASDRIALINSKGTIVAVNRNWLQLERIQPGGNYLDACRRESSLSRDARETMAGIRAVLKGKLTSFGMDYTGSSLRVSVTPILYADARVAITHTDISEFHSLARRLIHAQEDERQRISREMHDDLGNRIALLAFSIRKIMQQQSGLDLSEALDKVMDLAKATRSLSHDLHPPMLEFGEIDGALKSLCEEFARGKEIQIHVNTPDNASGLPPEVSLCLYRLTQECLQNIVRHSAAKTASVILRRTPSLVHLRVSDTGKGFTESHANGKGGIGFMNMKERVRYMQGHLEIVSSPGAGTEVRVTIPL